MQGHFESDATQDGPREYLLRWADPEPLACLVVSEPRRSATFAFNAFATGTRCTLEIFVAESWHTSDRFP
jgi:hypothetical protein